MIQNADERRQIGSTSPTLGYRFLPMQDPEVVEMRTGGGGVPFLGLVFLVAGLFVMLLPLGLIPVQNAEFLAGFIFLLLGGAFTALGVFIVFGRGGSS